MLEQIELIDKIQEYRDTQPSDLNLKLTEESIVLLITAFNKEVLKAGGRIEPKVTPGYSIMPPSFSNEFHSSTESAALDNIENFEMVDYFFNKIQMGQESIDCVLNSDRKSRRKRIFAMRFIQGMDRPSIMEELAIETTVYHEDMAMAITQFACALGIEVKKS
ncbi:ArpU family phage packaging/lysis transcriptional regulator [Brochothrix thermosphacta]|uniref:ArpU family phage packaging/lysis transcriptional regulator n=1 Tax=Brochothrix thermosphacta TaxID=2756 RepID=UPI0003E8B573|nr:ArpU family phage packaging/lysis transcriptional regulator [Brochothrix thermosphacta]EUJ38190.1 gp66 [Brochothrix thermosphacta DSM 20171 = FSL F6-1036]ODJ49216.1 hypothetical protein BFR34_06145 [Brochothrix thermosphacta DSM 20171 = FSL F6-1036]